MPPNAIRLIAVPRPRIKICGITRQEDALAAAQAGADAIGLNFYPKARRCIDTDTARSILRALPAFVTPVALFVDQQLDFIRRTADQLQLRHIQLHGHEEPDIVAALRDYTVLKSIKVSPSTLRAELDLWRESIPSLDLRNLQGFLLETPNTGVPGGSGVENDWNAIEAAQRDGAFANLPPIIVAGGLRPDNVADVVRRLNPYAVDVASGVEDAPGQKSAAKIQAFVDEVTRAFDR
jgi:phosphoribosylanthranilate isomerase